MATEEVTTKDALATSFDLVQDRLNLISQRDHFERDPVEERMLLITGAILCKLLSDENKSDTTNESNER